MLIRIYPRAAGPSAYFAFWWRCLTFSGRRAPKEAMHVRVAGPGKGSRRKTVPIRVPADPPWPLPLGSQVQLLGNLGMSPSFFLAGLCLTGCGQAWRAHPGDPRTPQQVWRQQCHHKHGKGESAVTTPRCEAFTVAPSRLLAPPPRCLPFLPYCDPVWASPSEVHPEKSCTYFMCLSKAASSRNFSDALICPGLC